MGYRLCCQLAESGSGAFRAVWRKIKRDPESIIHVEKVGLDRVRHGHGYAYVGDKLPIWKYMASCRKCGMTLMREEFDESGMGMVIRQGAPYRRRFNEACVRIIIIFLYNTSPLLKISY